MLTIRYAMLFATLAASAGCAGAAPGGSGQVLDWSTHEPIAEARAVLTGTAVTAAPSPQTR